MKMKYFKIFFDCALLVIHVNMLFLSESMACAEDHHGPEKMGDWINNPTARQKIAARLHKKYYKKRTIAEKENEVNELRNIEETWKAACEQGKENGGVSLCWLDLKHVNSKIYSFRSDYGQELKHLRLDGLGLKTLEEIPTHCRELEMLSLASNFIQEINEINTLVKLTQLNLLRNRLRRLPASIGELKYLVKLDLANNFLTSLPTEISDLRRLKHFNLECNELSSLPLAFGKLECEVVNLSYNKFTFCPDSIVGMKNLKQLSMNYNQIVYLPACFRRLKKLEIFHISRNRLTIIPDSIVDMTSLTCLWFDFNQLSALPPNFHRLTKLRELKLEGNADLVYPPIQIIAKGTEEVMRWSRQRLEMAKSARIRHIIQQLAEVLDQVQRHKIGGALHESIFRVVGDTYQFVPNALFDIFLPELLTMWSDPENEFRESTKTFPYERTDVEQAMFQYRDASGSIVRKTAHGRFLSCSCMQTRKSSAVCFPLCTRPALLMRKKCYEENMREKRRVMAEEKSLLNAEREAKAEAKAYLESIDGVLNVREEAINRMASEEATEKYIIHKILKRLLVPPNIK